MIMFNGYSGYFLGAVISWLMITFVSLYPFFLQRYCNKHYTGIWRKLGNMNKSPIRALGFPVGWAVANVIIYSLLNLDGVLKIVTISGAIIVFGAYIWWAEYYSRKTDQ